MPSFPDVPEASIADFEAVSSEQWEALARKRIFFGHQSVGENLVAGLQAVLEEHPEIPLRIVETTDLSTANAPGLYHARIGQNGSPASKMDAFSSIVGEGAPGVGALKYCYVDVTAQTDPAALFAEYKADIEGLRRSDPGLVVVHVTMPLTTIEGRREVLMSWLRRTPTARDLNVVRNHYNALLRRAYVGKEPVFDLARVESTLPDGRRTFFTRDGSPVYILAQEYTDDGGHLNEAGRKAAAREFLAVLAGL